MPTILVNREQLYAELGQTMSDEAFDELCFEYGIELDEVTSQRKLVAKEQGESKAASIAASGPASALFDEVIYRIEVPANRYDLNSPEGLWRALKVFLNAKSLSEESNAKEDLVVNGSCNIQFEPFLLSQSDCPTAAIPGPVTLQVGSHVASVRPFIACAILRNVQMNQFIFDSLIELQEKLHSGLGRRRSIISIGTYDMDTLCLESQGDSPTGPSLIYDALLPSEFSFVPLNRTECVDGTGLFTMLESDLKLRKFLPLLQDCERIPVLRDRQGTILSVAPLINGNSSKITLNTKNILIDVTGVDANKVSIALNIIVTTFSRYSSSLPESVSITSADQQTVSTFPILSPYPIDVSLSYINRSLGLNLSSTEALSLIKRMMLSGSVKDHQLSRLSASNGHADVVSDTILTVWVPAIRPDIIHQCDVMEDMAISYGFNRLPAKMPSTSTIAMPFPLNKLTDQLRRETALAGFTEVLTFSLCSHPENYSMLGRTDPGNEAVRLSAPKTLEFEIVQTTLMSAMLKTLASNRKMTLPMRIFQIADVVLQLPAKALNAGSEESISNGSSTGSVSFIEDRDGTGARNERRLCAAYCGLKSGFEAIHGLLDRLMLMLKVPTSQYSISPSALPTFFPDRQATVIFNGKVIGSFGIVHPNVMNAFDVPHVCSMIEICIEPFL